MKARTSAAKFTTRMARSLFSKVGNWVVSEKAAFGLINGKAAAKLCVLLLIRSRACLHFELLEPLRTNLMDDPAELFDL